MATGVGAVVKAACVLRTLAGAPDALSVRQLAAKTGIPRSTVHAICATLQREGLLQAVPGAGYHLAPLTKPGERAESGG